ncbi:MAG: hypothetical protein Q9218_000958 [Villophora microphyllina]
MVRMREIHRTATFAWSPATASNYIATGTRAGAVDADFSNETQLEIWDLALDDADSKELQPIASVDTDSRLVNLLLKDKILVSSEVNLNQLLRDSFLSRTSKHSGAIKALQFNPFRHELLATAGAKGELFISDLNNIGNPYRMGNSVARADDFECVDWNKNVPHITVTGSSGGFVTVWDVKTKKESLTLNNMGRKAVSAVVWDPNKHTRLVTAIPQDTDPLILVWDLRNANTPERVLRGHDGGILSLSWCTQDNDLLISCGKDNRTICWNPQTGEAYGEYPVVTNWTFQTRWNPHNPSLLATASFDGKITVHPLQNTQADTRQSTGAPTPSPDDADFFNKAQSDTQANTFSLPKAPKWLRRPCGVAFGFGGKVVSFNAVEVGAYVTSKIRVSTFTNDAGIGQSTTEFEKALRDKNMIDICQRHITEEADESEKADWKVIQTLTSRDPRKDLIQHLGFSSNDETEDGVGKLTVNTDQVDDDSRAKSNGISTARQNRLSAFFENSEEDSFLSDLAATKGAKINNPFQVYSGKESEPDRRITRALLLGQFDTALDVCLQEDRLSDAFMVAICGGQSCIEKAQKAYFNRKSQGPNYLRLLASVVGKNLWDIVYNANLDNWREVMATLCTYAITEEFPDLCEALGDRLDEQAKNGDPTSTSRQDASFCYLAGSRLEKVVGIWISELEQRERSESQTNSDDSAFGIHARLLQHFIEKVTVFREATRFQDKEVQAKSGWKLGLLYDKYTEYADMVASYGQLQIAERYLDLLPKHYPAAEAARERIKRANRKPEARDAPKQVPTTGRAQPRNPGSLVIDNQLNQAKPAPNPSNPYVPSSTYSTQPYPPTTQTPYNPAGYSDGPRYQQNQLAAQPTVRPPQRQGQSYSNQMLGPPPRTINASPSVPPPSKASNMGNWNDMPEDFFKAPSGRRGTPGPPPSGNNSSYGYPSNSTTPGMAAPPLGGIQHKPTPPPPPKGPPRSGSPMTTVLTTPTSHDRPPSSATNAYAPQQPPYQHIASQQPGHVPRGPSPYNPPPSGAPTSNRYTPVPQTAKETYPVAYPPGPNRTGPPPPNPYAPQPGYNQAPSQSSNGLVHNTAIPPSTGPPPRSSDRDLAGPGPSRAEKASVQQSEGIQNVVPVPAKHAPGDRSHIPLQSRPIFELLSSDMQRVKARAPANFQKQVNDTEKRLNILFDHLNNEDLLKEDTVGSMVELSQALQARNYEHAQVIHLDLLTNKTDQCGQWMFKCLDLVNSTPHLPAFQDQLHGACCYIKSTRPAMEEPQSGSTNASSESPAQKQARLRRERREAKIKAGGSSRLDQISQLSGRSAETAPPPPQPLAQGPALSSINNDPDEVDISDHVNPVQPSHHDGGPTEADIRQLLRSAPPQDPGQQQPEGQEDPMVRMLQQIMGGLPGTEGGEQQDGLPAGLAALLGGGGGGSSGGAGAPGAAGQGQRREGNTMNAYLWKVIHASIQDPTMTSRAEEEEEEEEEEQEEEEQEEEEQEGMWERDYSGVLGHGAAGLAGAVEELRGAAMCQDIPSSMPADAFEMVERPAAGYINLAETANIPLVSVISLTAVELAGQKTLPFGGQRMGTARQASEIFRGRYGVTGGRNSWPD